MEYKLSISKLFSIFLISRTASSTSMDFISSRLFFSHNMYIYMQRETFGKKIERKHPHQKIEELRKMKNYKADEKKEERTYTLFAKVYMSEGDEWESKKSALSISSRAYHSKHTKERTTKT